MIDCAKLCEAIGLDPRTFYLDTHEDTVAVMSNYAMARTLLADEYNSERDVLLNVIELYQGAIPALVNEVDLMINFYNTYYKDLT